MLLCDFHIHTTWSDGSVRLPDAVDLYGQAGFDVIAITDHVHNTDGVIGSFAGTLDKTVLPARFPAYLDELRREAERAEREYGLLVLPGVEITKEYLSQADSAHVLLIGIDRFVSADQPWEGVFHEAREQDALVVACHPHHTDHEIRDTLYFWNNREKYKRHFDAWEVANRTDLFSVVSLSNYPCVANGDFHDPAHLYSWKTLLPCERTWPAVRASVRDNRGVAITLFRNGTARGF